MLQNAKTFNKSGVYDFSCVRCGTCCSQYQPRLSLTEAQGLADHLEVNWKDFLRDYIDPRWPGTRSFLIKRFNGVCLFLQTFASKKQRLCRIQAFKPACCREWKSGLDRPECWQGLSAVWGLTVDPAGRINGDKEKLKEFEVFLQTIEE